MSTKALGGTSKRKSLAGTPDMPSGTRIDELNFTMTQAPITDEDRVTTNDREYVTGGLMGVETNQGGEGGGGRGKKMGFKVAKGVVCGFGGECMEEMEKREGRG